MDTALSIANIAATVFLGLAGMYLAYSLRRQLKLKVTDRRMESYAQLWALMQTAGDPHRKGSTALSSERDRQRLHEGMTNWYFEGGNGMLLPRTTREVYLLTKHNLACSDAELQPALLIDRRPQDLSNSNAWRAGLSMRQLSLLRAQMRSDLDLYGFLPRRDRLDDIDVEFLTLAGVSLRRAPWRANSYRRGIARWRL